MVLKNELNPSKNPSISWCYSFLPALIGYLVVLMNYINAKPYIGKIESYKPEFDKLFPSSSRIEIISTDMMWTEGPLWIDDADSSTSYLLFSDTIKNRIYRWEEGKGLFTIGRSVYLEKSGCKSNSTYCLSMLQTGSNGLVHLSNTKSTNIVLCQHGERSVTILFENGTRIALATHYNGQRLNSPNDLAWSKDGNLYFTDPIYGLLDQTTKKVVGQELPFSGVYMIPKDSILETIRSGRPTTDVRLVSDDIKYPNGISFSTDFRKLYVANSDSTNMSWYVFNVSDDGKLGPKMLFYEDTPTSTTTELSSLTTNTSSSLEYYGNADGMKVDGEGNLYCTGPGGLLVLSPKAELLGRLLLGKAATNVALGGDGRVYITTGDSVLRVKANFKSSRKANLNFIK